MSKNEIIATEFQGNNEITIPELQNKYQCFNYGHALEILKTNYVEEWNDIVECLNNLRITPDEILKAGGNKSPIPEKFDEFLFPREWTETKIVADLRVVKMDRKSRTKQGGKFKADRTEEIVVKGFIDGHNVDFIKGKVAFDLEWNSKDQTFDRDLLAMRNYFDARIIDVGIIVTRAEDLNEIFTALGKVLNKDIKKKYGASTTWMGKLKPRLDARRNGGCPILAIGIRKECVERDEQLIEYYRRLEELRSGEEV